jgi:hypothetical protein
MKEECYPLKNYTEFKWCYISEVQGKGIGEIRSGDYTVCYSRGVRAERGTAIVLHKNHSEKWCQEDCV